MNDTIMHLFSKSIFKTRLFIVILSMCIGTALSKALNSANVTNINAILCWTLGFGIFGLIALHARSFFSTDNLGRFYSRLYGAAFGLVYTSLIFLLFTVFYVGQANSFFNEVTYATIFSTALYNFIKNNYSGIEKEHLIASKMLEKQLKQDEIDKEKRKSQKK